MPRNRYTNLLRWSIFNASETLKDELDLEFKDRHFLARLFFPASKPFTSREVIKTIVGKVLRK